MNQARTNQGGSVVSFLVIGAILVGVTLAGVYFVQQRNNSEPIATSPSPSPSVSMPPTSPAPSQSVAPSTPKPSSSPLPSSHPATGTAPTGNLPQTGPAEDVVASLIPVAALVGATVSYVGSRRARYDH